MIIKELNYEHLPLCVDIAFLRNNQPENNSAYCPKSREGIQGDFEYVMSSAGSLVVGYFTSDETSDGLAGFLLCYMNPENSWVDCVGPFFSNEWNEDVAKKMFSFADTKLTNAARFNFYFNTNNKNLHELMTVLSAERRDNEYNLLLKKSDYKTQQIKHNIVPYSNRFESDVKKILIDTFPDSYVTGNELIASIGKDREVFCALDESGAFVGYGVLKLYDDTYYVTAEIFAVAEGYRGKGYGWALLNSVVECAFNVHNADRVGLIVDRLNTHARDLYYSCGFKLDVENSSYCVKK